MVASSTRYSSCTKTLKSELGRRPEWTHLVAGRVIDAYIGPLLVASLRSRLSNGENNFSVTRLYSLFGYGQCANTLNKKVLNCILLIVDTIAAISFQSLELNPMEQFQPKMKYQIKIEALLNSDTLSSKISKACNMMSRKNLFGCIRHSISHFGDCIHENHI